VTGKQVVSALINHMCRPPLPPLHLDGKTRTPSHAFGSYNNEHTGREYQNMTFLTKLCEASLKVNWEELPVAREVGLDQELIAKHKGLIDDVKKTLFNLEVKMVGLDGSIYIRVDLVEGDIQSAYETFTTLQYLLKKHKVQNDDVLVLDSYIKIELK